ncbi:class I SAM-dependent methyltransferase [Candidatus Gracilibacteria bacterium 28_42_T64]|nr:class I SAM-dependent methyltransferase [Candidatus Gracilibacteria bacterium 28_42_T64]
MLFTRKKYKDIVSITNEVFHDFENATYDDIHPEIFNKEEESILKLISFINKDSFKKFDILDIGTGTGFIPMCLEKNNLKFKSFTCFDGSKKKLDIVNSKLKDIGTSSKYYSKKFPEDLEEVNSHKYDLITINSVLHHMVDYKEVLNGLSSNVKKGGFLLINHEPNNNFNYSIGYFLYKILNYFDIKGILLSNLHSKIYYYLIDKIGKDLSCSPYYLTAKYLYEHKLTDIILTPTQVSQIVDYNSPTSGLYFNPHYTLDLDFLGELGFKQVFKIETDFLSKLSSKYPNLEKLVKKFNGTGSIQGVLLYKNN